MYVCTHVRTYVRMYVCMYVYIHTNWISAKREIYTLKYPNV